MKRDLSEKCIHCRINYVVKGRAYCSCCLLSLQRECRKYPCEHERSRGEGR